MSESDLIIRIERLESFNANIKKRILKMVKDEVVSLFKEQEFKDFVLGKASEYITNNEEKTFNKVIDRTLQRVNKKFTDSYTRTLTLATSTDEEIRKVVERCNFDLSKEESIALIASINFEQTNNLLIEEKTK